MTGNARTLTYPPEGLGAPKDRHPGPLVESGLPAGTEVFSADDHISLGEDIFYERFPESMKERAPRVMNVGGGWVIGMDGKSVLVPEFIEVLTQYDPVSGSHTGDVPARLAALESEGVSKELAFPNAILALFGWPDREVRELCFRIYNEHIAEVQERSNNRIFGVGLINWWDADGARRTVNELKALGLKTFLMPLSPGKDVDKRPIDYASIAMDGVWEAIEDAQIPVSHHIGESPPTTPNEFNAVGIGMLQSVAPFRDTFGKYIFGGILDRHPGLRVGWFEGGINWVPSAIQDAEHIVRPSSTWRTSRFGTSPGTTGRTTCARPSWSTRSGSNSSTVSVSSGSCGPPTSPTTKAPTGTAASRWRRSSTRSAPRMRRRSSAATSSDTSGWTTDARRPDGLGGTDTHSGEAGLCPHAA